jgi:hypothetical protein
LAKNSDPRTLWSWLNCKGFPETAIAPHTEYEGVPSMSKPPNDFWRDVYESNTYVLRGRLFRRGSFDIIDSLERSVLYVKPRRILGNAKGIFAIKDGNPEVMYVQDVSGAKDVYLKGRATCEFRDSPTNELMGMLRTEGLLLGGEVKSHVLDPQGQKIGTVEERASPGWRFGSKPGVDIYVGLMNSRKVFEFKVNIESFGFEMRADFSMDEQGELDRRLGLGLAVYFAGVARTPTSD